MSARTVAAVDLGAESGRVTAVSFDGSRLHLRVVHRFANTPSVRDGLLRWDIDDLWTQIRSGLGTLAAGDEPVESVGVDTWGVDYGLLDARGALLDDPVSYRDSRNVAAFDSAMATVGARRMYQATGVQLMPINTLFGLLADVRNRPERLRAASTLLMMPDVFHHLLSGSTVSEFTAVSTSGAYDMAHHRWAVELLDELGIPTGMLPEVVPAGTDVGPLLGDLAAGALAGARVVVPPGHDTASAVVGTPLTDPAGLYISSGTWSLAGVELGGPVVGEASQAVNLTNEGGYADTVRLLRNVMGLWILQECRRQWAREGRSYDYPELAGMASTAPGLVSLVNPDDVLFLPPGDMPRRIREYCAATGQPVPETDAAIARCVVDSLALSYRVVVDDIAAVTGVRAPSVKIVGGGANNALLSQLTADATGLPVRCGPVEATALGNAGVQLATAGEFAGIAEIRAAIAASGEMVEYAPRSDPRLDDALGAFTALRARRPLTSITT
jgi:rhamnulokinase